MRENEPPAPPPAPGTSRLRVSPEEEQPATAPDGGTILVSGFRFEGNEKVSSEALRRGVPALEQALGTDIGLGALNALANRVTQYYRNQGFLIATAYLPPQEVEGGIVTIAVFEGKIDSAGIVESGGYAADRIKRYRDQNLCDNATPGCAGVVLEHARLERALGIIADLPGIAEVTGTLAPGGQVGTSDFDLTATTGPAWVGQLAVDNYGNHYTGRMRLNTGLQVNNPAGIGDRASLNFITSGEGLNYGSVDYNLPVGYAGWRLGLDYTLSTYVLGAPFDVTDSHGKAQALTAYASYPLIRSNDRNLFLSAGYSFKWLEDSVLDETLTKEEQALSIGLNGNRIDQFAHGGFTNYGLTLTPGTLSQDDPLAGEVEAAASRFLKTNYNLSRDQTLAYLGIDRLSLYGMLVGQWAWDNLDSAEKFYLGGPGGVRAYPIGEAPGDIGNIATLELRYSRPVEGPVIGKSDLTVAVFRDQGWLTTNSTTWPGYNGPQHRQIGGNGVALSLHRRDAYICKLMWAARDRGGEAATSDTDTDNRLWAQMSITF